MLYLALILPLLLGHVAHYAVKCLSYGEFLSYVDCLKHKPFTTFRTLCLLSAAYWGVILTLADPATFQAWGAMWLAGYGIDYMSNAYPTKEQK